MDQQTGIRGIRLSHRSQKMFLGLTNIFFFEFDN